MWKKKHTHARTERDRERERERERERGHATRKENNMEIRYVEMKKIKQKQRR